MAYYEGYTQTEIASRLDIALGTVKTRTSRGLQRLAALLESREAPRVNGHVFDDLPLLLTGEADRATVAAVTAHLRECDDCRDELISAVAAHAALMSAVKFAADLVEPQPLGDSQLGPGRRPARAGSLRSLRRDPARTGRRRGTGRTRPPGLDQSPGSRRRARPTAAHRRRNWIAAAAAVVVLARRRRVPGHADRLESGRRRATLHCAAYGEGTTPASAKLIGDDKMSLDASSLPALATGSYYEVWLTNGARTAMAPVGVLDADRKATHHRAGE